IGSWKIIESLSPRRSRSRLAGSLSRSLPSNSTSPPTMRPGGCGTSPMIESAVTLLPQPDSPTMPSVRPRSRRKLTPSTARTSPCSPWNEVRSPLTSSRWFVAGNRFLDARAVELAPRMRLARGAAHERDEALVRLVVEAPELGGRLRMIVDAQAQLGVLLGRMDEERGRLLAALVAAGGLARFQRRDEAFSERFPGLLISARGFPDDALVGEHVACHRIAIARERAAPVDALLPGVLADHAACVDDMELALLATFVRRDEAFHGLGCTHAGAQELEALPSVVRIHQRLGGKRADAATHMRAERARGEEARRDGDAECAARVVAGDDRPRHAAR